jgi:phosphoribosyl-ATP pyrophosphohydrolase/phosphoribosyl-AMP cyclohydrolase
MSRESLKYTKEEGVCAFVSRSDEKRNSTKYMGTNIWVKGSTSGNTQEFIDTATNDEKDCLLVYVSPKKPACCKGPNGCFFRPMAFGGEDQ